MNENNLFPCPSCGFLIFSELVGSYEICSICGWEDDDVQLRYPGMRGGANGGSLKEYQDNILKRIPAGTKEYGEYRRASDWRPLNPDEVITANKGTGINYFKALGEEPKKYYWKK